MFSKYPNFILPRFISMLLIPYRFMGLTMDRTWWIIRGPSELVPPMLKLAMYFMIWQWSSTENYFITHCVTIMYCMHIWLEYWLVCGPGHYHLSQLLICYFFGLRPFWKRCIGWDLRRGVQTKLLTSTLTVCDDTIIILLQYNVWIARRRSIQKYSIFLLIGCTSHPLQYQVLTYDKFWHPRGP